MNVYYYYYHYYHYSYYYYYYLQLGDNDEHCNIYYVTYCISFII